MGFFADIRKQWRDIRSTKKISEYGIVCESRAKGTSTTYEADIREISGERFLYLHERRHRSSHTGHRVMDITKDELIHITKHFEEAIQLM